MKFAKTFTAVLLLLASLAICFGQSKPVPVLVDTFGATTCGDLNARLFIGGKALSDNPDSLVYIIIYGRKASTRENYRQEGRIRTTLRILHYDMNRFVIAHAAPVGDVKTEQWLVLPGADKPVFEEIKPDYSLKIDKPVVYYRNGYFVDNECPVNIDEIYSKILLENTNLRGNIAIHETSPKKFQKEKRLLTVKLVKNYKVPLKRLKFYYVKTDQLWTSGVEFWLVPKRK